MVIAEWVKVSMAAAITEQHITDFVKKRESRTVDETELDNIHSAIKDVKMSTTRDAEDRVWTLYENYIEVLVESGFNEVHKTHPHISIKHIYNIIEHSQLKRCMKNIVHVKKLEKLDEADYNMYMRELPRQSTKL